MIKCKGKTFSQWCQVVGVGCPESCASSVLQGFKDQTISILDKAQGNPIWPCSSSCFGCLSGQETTGASWNSELPCDLVICIDCAWMSHALSGFQTRWPGGSLQPYVTSGICEHKFLAKWQTSFSLDYSKYFWLQRRDYGTLTLPVQDRMLSSQTCLIALELLSSHLPQAFFLQISAFRSLLW